MSVPSLSHPVSGQLNSWNPGNISLLTLSLTSIVPMDTPPFMYHFSSPPKPTTPLRETPQLWNHIRNRGCFIIGYSQTPISRRLKWIRTGGAVLGQHQGHASPGPWPKSSTAHTQTDPHPDYLWFGTVFCIVCCALKLCIWTPVPGALLH